MRLHIFFSFLLLLAHAAHTSAASPMVDGSYRYNVALKEDGTVWVWGYNYELGAGDGMLGDGGNTFSTQAPIQVLEDHDHDDATPAIPMAQVIKISAAYSHALVLKSDGSVWAWGSNSSGICGQGTVGGAYSPAVRVRGVGGNGSLTDIIDIAAGTGHNLALASDGRVLAWGSNQFGELGPGLPLLPPYSHSFPAYVKAAGAAADITGIVAIEAGHHVSFAIDESGTLLSWGTNTKGALGRGTLNLGPFPDPSPVVDESNNPIRGITTVATPGYGLQYASALDSEGRTWIWGENYVQQEDLYAATQSATGSSSNYKALVAGYNAPCGVNADGTAEIWQSESINDNLLRADMSDRSSPVIHGVMAISCSMADLFVKESGVLYSLAHRHSANATVLGHTDLCGWDKALPVLDETGEPFRLFEGVADSGPESTCSSATSNNGTSGSSSASGGAGGIDSFWLFASFALLIWRRSTTRL